MQDQQSKYTLILDSLQKLLENKNLQSISVSEIAQTAGIGKGSIYAYGYDLSGMPQYFQRLFEAAGRKQYRRC